MFFYRQLVPEPAILRIDAVFFLSQHWVGPQLKSWNSLGDEIEHIWHTLSVLDDYCGSSLAIHYGSVPSLVFLLDFPLSIVGQFPSTICCVHLQYEKNYQLLANTQLNPPD